MAEDLKPADVDQKNRSKSYWNKILNRCGLSMDSGIGIPTTLHGLPGRLPISYIGASHNVVGMEEEQYRRKHGKRKTSGNEKKDVAPFAIFD